MKKTFTISINNLSFVINDDAYSVLQDYIDEVSACYSSEDEHEILLDIEARIAELLKEKLGNEREVVTLEDVNSIISILGRPNQFDDENGETNKTESQDKKSNKKKKFYRDIDNKILGGVASGIAAYLKWDITLVRLILLVVLVFGFGWIIPFYLIVWLIAPAATTVAQKLEMRGENPTIENIKNYMDSDNFKKSTSEISSTIGRVIIMSFKILAIIIGLFLSAVSIIVIISLIIAFFALIFNFAFVPSLFFLGSNMVLNYVLLFSVAIFLIIPTVSIIHTTIRLLSKNRKPRKKGWSIAVLILWILSIISISICVVFHHNEFSFHKENISEIVYTASDKEVVVSDKSFNSVELTDAVNVVLIADTVDYVEVESNNKNLMNISVDSEVLYVTTSSKMKFNSSKLSTPKVFVHYRDLNHISCSSASYVESVAQIISDSLFIYASDASKVDLSVQCDYIAVEASDASKVIVDGNANQGLIEANSASVVEANNLWLKRGKANAQSMSTISINADTLSAEAITMSVIEYYNDPNITNLGVGDLSSVKQHK